MAMAAVVVTDGDGFDEELRAQHKAMICFKVVSESSIRESIISKIAWFIGGIRSCSRYLNTNPEATSSRVELSDKRYQNESHAEFG